MHSPFIKTGVGIRSDHFEDALNTQAAVGFFEAHSENYFGQSLSRQKLLQLRQHYPVSLHGVGLSLGRADGLDQQHLQQLKHLVDELDPLFVSEHLSWSAYAHVHVPDLLPLPLTEQALNIMCEHVDHMQSVLQRRILLENPSNYILFDGLQISEPEFLNALAQRTGCGLLLDVNNVYVSARNFGRNPQHYLDQIDHQHVEQYHLAGYSEHQDDREQVLIDTHDHPVHPPVWDLFDYVLRKLGDKPTLIEWDSSLPAFNVLLAEMEKAEQLRQKYEHVQLHASKPIAVKLPETLEIPKLEHIQQQFIEALFANEMPAKMNLSNDLSHRIWIYQNNVQQALINYLCQVFVVCDELVGRDFFRAMLKHYIVQMQPTSGNIHAYGATLADFIERFDPAQSVPYLVDVARLEWAEHHAYYATISQPVTPGMMAEYDQAEQLTMPIELNESVSLLESEFPIDDIYEQAQPDYASEVNVSLDSGGLRLLVFKQNNQIEKRVLETDIWQFLVAIQQNNNLLEVMQESLAYLDQKQITDCIAFVLQNELLTHKQFQTKRKVESE